MWGCARDLSLVSFLPAVYDRQRSPCVEKQCTEPTGMQSIVLRNGTNYKTYFIDLSYYIFLGLAG